MPANDFSHVQFDSRDVALDVWLLAPRENK